MNTKLNDTAKVKVIKQMLTDSNSSLNELLFFFKKIYYKSIDLYH